MDPLAMINQILTGLPLLGTEHLLQVAVAVICGISTGTGLVAPMTTELLGCVFAVFIIRLLMLGVTESSPHGLKTWAHARFVSAIAACTLWSTAAAGRINGRHGTVQDFHALRRAPSTPKFKAG